MIQNILVIIIILLSLSYIGYKIYKKLSGEKDGCEKGGCKDCPLKKECDTKIRKNKM